MTNGTLKKPLSLPELKFEYSGINNVLVEFVIKNCEFSSFVHNPTKDSLCR